MNSKKSTNRKHQQLYRILKI